MKHMKLAWKAQREDAQTCIETDVPESGPRYVICTVHEMLDDDGAGLKTARLLVQKHNDVLKQEIRDKHADLWLVQLPERVPFYVTVMPFTMKVEPVDGGPVGNYEFGSGEILAHEGTLNGRAFFVNGKGEIGSVEAGTWHLFCQEHIKLI